MSHLCPRAGCGETVPDKYLACRTDWFRIPMSLRKRVLDTWANGGGIYSVEYREARKAAIDFLNGKQ